MQSSTSVSIGTSGLPWGDAEKAHWRARQVVRRSYADEVLTAVNALRGRYAVTKYGRLELDPARYPLFLLRNTDWDDARPIVLVTGGVHGYETSGVHGALEFLRTRAADYAGRINLLVAPCISPWAYETIQRWNPHAVDPNRSFGNRAAQESAALLDVLTPLRERVCLHVDLHETTDSDESEFRPLLAARDGKPHEPGVIPDGFYLVDDSERPQTAFQSAIIAAVARVTHIAPADEHGCIIGAPLSAPGVIQYPFEKLGLCAGITPARYRTTTEVYPDSPRATPEQCIAAQLTAVCAAVDYVLEQASQR